MGKASVDSSNNHNKEKSSSNSTATTATLHQDYKNDDNTNTNNTNKATNAEVDDEYDDEPFGTGCLLCGSGKDEDKILLCEICDGEYHIYCLKPPLLTIPDDDWYCTHCITNGLVPSSPAPQLSSTASNGNNTTEITPGEESNTTDMNRTNIVSSSSTTPTTTDTSLVPLMQQQPLAAITIMDIMEYDGMEEQVMSLPPSFTSRFGEICWAQGGAGYGWWPCLICDPRSILEPVRSHARKFLGKKHLVYFFRCGYNNQNNPNPTTATTPSNSTTPATAPTPSTSPTAEVTATATNTNTGSSAPTGIASNAIPAITTARSTSPNTTGTSTTTNPNHTSTNEIPTTTIATAFVNNHNSPFSLLSNKQIKTWNEGLAEEFYMGRAAKNSGKFRHLLFQEAFQIATLELEKPPDERLEWDRNNVVVMSPLDYQPPSPSSVAAPVTTPAIVLSSGAATTTSETTGTTIRRRSIQQSTIEGDSKIMDLSSSSFRSKATAKKRSVSDNNEKQQQQKEQRPSSKKNRILKVSYQGSVERKYAERIPLVQLLGLQPPNEATEATMDDNNDTITAATEPVPTTSDETEADATTVAGSS